VIQAAQARARGLRLAIFDKGSAVTHRDMVYLLDG
jgi:hypothetical protein